MKAHWDIWGADWDGCVWHAALHDGGPCKYAWWSSLHLRLRNGEDAPDEMWFLLRHVVTDDHQFDSITKLYPTRKKDSDVQVDAVFETTLAVEQRIAGGIYEITKAGREAVKRSRSE